MYPAAHLQFFLRTKFAKKLALQAHVTLRTGVSVRSVRDAKRGRHPAARSPKLRRLVQGGGGGVPLPLPRGLPRRHSAFFAGSRKLFQTSKLAARLGSFSQESAHAPSVPHSEEASTKRRRCGRLRSPPEAARKASTGVFRQGRAASSMHQGRDTPAKAAKTQIGGCARRRTQALCPRAWA